MADTLKEKKSFEARVSMSSYEKCILALKKSKLSLKEEELKLKNEELEFKKKTAKLKLHFWQQITPGLKDLK